MGMRPCRSSRRRTIHTSLALLTLAIAYAPPVLAQQTDRPTLPEPVSLPEEFAVVLRNYEAAWGARDAEALANLFTEDGFVLRPGHPPVRGREGIRAAYANSGGPLSLRAYDFGREGAVGFIIGGYSPDPGIPEGGKFVLALRRVASGEWLIAADMDNGN